MKKIIETKRAPMAIGPYSQGLIFNNFIFLSGQIPIVPETNEVILDDIERASKQVFKNIKALLKEAGADMDRVMMTTIYLKNLSDFPVVNEIYKEYFHQPYPARVTVGVSELPKNVQIEVSVIAYI